jgi:5-methylcytosine-specific restriction endonuclease McrA
MLTAWGILCVFAMAAGAIAVAVYYHRSEQIRARREEETRFRGILVSELRKKGLSGLNFHRLIDEYGVPEEVARETAANLYAAYCKGALADAQVTERERRQLDSLRRALAIPPEVAAAIEARLTDEVYRRATSTALADGIITREEAEELQRLRNQLGLSAQRASAIAGAPARDAYLALFKRVVCEGRMTPEELAELQQYREALGISRDEANDIVREDAMRLYRQWFYNIIQDGEVTPEEEQGLCWLKNEFGLHSLDTKVYEAQLEEVKRLARYRAGHLPTVRTGRLLEGGEICHWQGPCCFRWETATQIKEAQGELVVTSKQMVFLSPTKSFRVLPSRIIDIEVYGDAVVIRSTSKGTGTYFVSEPRTLEAILVGLVRRHKYQLSAKYSSEISRHIPDSVRREVWQRDGGRCVRCGATDYLEFDHIIPYSKGGANTAANIQVLCRRCNIQKGDRI